MKNALKTNLRMPHSYEEGVKVGELETELVELNANNAKLQCSHNELVEYKLILQKFLWMIDATLVVQDLKRNQYDAKRLPMITFGYSICSSMVLLQKVVSKQKWGM
uniref:Uncharacterized protein n=1 Tax=Cucumis melo TaxID=3656 RepID=A0A9I9EIK0_CUCME